MAKSLNGLTESTEEKLINSRKRVRKHGEVFTPSHIVRKMLDLPGIYEACHDLTTTFFEPGIGEGAFLVEILRRKLRMVEKEYNHTLEHYENYSLLALSTIYGIELLPDNTTFSTMVLYNAFYDMYLRQARRHNRRPKLSVKKSAMLIISKNIVQGNFLTKLISGGTPVVYSEWKATNLDLGLKSIPITVQRTEYTLMEIEKGIKKAPGAVVDPNDTKGQMTIPFPEFDQEAQKGQEMRYLPCPITSVHREEQEVING